ACSAGRGANVAPASRYGLVHAAICDHWAISFRVYGLGRERWRLNPSLVCIYCEDVNYRRENGPMAIEDLPAAGHGISRWWRVFGGVSMNLALGTLYAWS